MSKQNKPTVFVAMSIDVEEEGLFSGRYPRAPEGISNVAELQRLIFVSSEFSIPLTLLADYPVLASPICCGHLALLHENNGAEIGTHLHHWNTPPFQGPDIVQIASTLTMAGDLLTEKLQNLTDVALHGCGIVPTSFRMGRFDFSPIVRQIIPKLGYFVDSSVVPFRFCPGTIDQLFSSADPYILLGGGRGLLEVPVTMVAVSRSLAMLAALASDYLPVRAVRPALEIFRRLAVCGPHPAWFSLASMKNAARLHIHRGGRVLNIFLHSTEIAPYMSPASSDKHKADAILTKLRSFLAWLCDRYEVRGVTLSELPSLVHQKVLKIIK
jgi:hypothetical protein